MTNIKNESVRSLIDIAAEIKEVWKNIYFAAVPYLNAMSCLQSINDTFGQESAADIVRYFLSNVSTWRGEDARRIKLELNNILKQI
jgi:hypothetical protein